MRGDRKTKTAEENTVVNIQTNQLKWQTSTGTLSKQVTQKVGGAETTCSDSTSLDSEINRNSMGVYIYTPDYQILTDHIFSLLHFYLHDSLYILFPSTLQWFRHAVEQLVEALRYKPEGSGFDSRWCHWIFFIGIILPAALWLRGSTQHLTKMSTRNVSWE
jgi:hypothetical protein